MWEFFPHCARLDTMSDNSQGQIPSSLVNAIQWLLRPLIKLLLTHKITFPTLASWLKQIYVEVADEEFRLPNKKQTDSRISMLTGVHRKDIRKFRELEHKQEAPFSVGAQMIAIWTSQPPFFDVKKNQPKLLEIENKSKAASFEALVKLVCKQDIRPRVVLDEWLENNIVTLDESKQKVYLNTSAFIPEKSFDDKALFFGKLIRDHIATGNHNLSGDGDPFFDRSVFYNHLTEESLEEISEYLNKEGMKLLQDINKKAKELQQQDHNKPSAIHRFNIGLFMLKEEIQKDGEPDQEDNDNEQ